MAPFFFKNTRVLRKGDPEPPLVEGRARIYSNRFCPFAERLLLYAAAKEFEIEVVNIDVVNKPEWYFNKHPQGKIPAFEKDGKILIESSIIAEYLDDIDSSTSILPSDPYLRAKQKVLLLQAAPLITFYPNLVNIIRNDLQGEARAAKVKPVEEAIDAVEKLLNEDYFGGACPGYADWMLFPIFERVSLFSTLLSLGSLFPSARWPSLSAWWNRINAHPAAAAVTLSREVHLAFINCFLEGNTNPDICVY